MTPVPRARRPAEPPPGPRVRRRPADERPEIELSDEELTALADEGIDPDDVRRLSTRERDGQEASEHDRDTARDEIEGLTLEQQDEDY